jgi:hypothetical protein
VHSNADAPLIFSQLGFAQTQLGSPRLRLRSRVAATLAGVGSEDDDDEESKPKKLHRPSKRIATAKSKAQVQFVEPDGMDESDTPYRASQDGSPRYSGVDDDMPLARSPHQTRSKRPAKGKAAGKKRGTLLLRRSVHRIQLIVLPNSTLETCHKAFTRVVRRRRGVSKLRRYVMLLN